MKTTIGDRILSALPDLLQQSNISTQDFFDNYIEMSVKDLYDRLNGLDNYWQEPYLISQIQKHFDIRFNHTFTKITYNETKRNRKSKSGGSDIPGFQP